MRRSIAGCRLLKPEAFGDELPTLIHLDPPDHTRLRRLVQVAFTPRRVEAIRRRAESLVDETLGRFGPGDEIDVIAELAYPLPLTIICDLLGIAESDRSFVQEQSTWLARSIDPGVLRTPDLNDRIAVAQEAFVDFMRELVAQRRRNPTDDLLGQLVQAELEGDRLTESELLGLAVLLLVAGHETTVSLIGNGLVALLGSETQRRLVSNGEVDSRLVVDEVLRHDSPVQMTTRIALEPIDLGNATIPAGNVAILLLGSANRDDAAFTEGERFDVTALRDHAHLSFGNGIHHCLGAALARAEGEVAIPALLRRFPAVTLLDEPKIRPTFVLRGRETLRVRL